MNICRRYGFNPKSHLKEKDLQYYEDLEKKEEEKIQKRNERKQKREEKRNVSICVKPSYDSLVTGWY